MTVNRRFVLIKPDQVGSKSGHVGGTGTSSRDIQQYKCYLLAGISFTYVASP